MAQQLKVLAALAKDVGLAPSTHTAAHYHLQLRAFLMPSFGLHVY